MEEDREDWTQPLGRNECELIHFRIRYRALTCCFKSIQTGRNTVRTRRWDGILPAYHLQQMV